MADTATNLGQIERTTKPAREKAVTAKPVRLLQQYFYFFMSLLIAAVVAFGFSHTVEARLIHGVPRRPLLLWVHGAIFSGWVLFFVFQSLLVRTHNVRLHRTFGWFGAALGSAVFVVGVWTGYVMSRFRIQYFHGERAVGNLVLSWYDVTAFAVAFGLAILWRKRPEYHRRLILLATCALTSAGFARFPFAAQMPRAAFFAGVDLLVLMGVARDLIVDKRVHRVYVVGLPVFVVCQCIVMYTILNNPPYWVHIANAVLR
jgi:hypothetical protein